MADPVAVPVQRDISRLPSLDPPQASQARWCRSLLWRGCLDRGRRSCPFVPSMPPSGEEHCSGLRPSDVWLNLLFVCNCSMYSPMLFVVQPSKYNIPRDRRVFQDKTQGPWYHGPRSGYRPRVHGKRHELCRPSQRHRWDDARRNSKCVGLRLSLPATLITIHRKPLVARNSVLLTRRTPATRKVTV